MLLFVLREVGAGQKMQPNFERPLVKAWARGRLSPFLDSSHCLLGLSRPETEVDL